MSFVKMWQDRMHQLFGKGDTPGHEFHGNQYGGGSGGGKAPPANYHAEPGGKMGIGAKVWHAEHGPLIVQGFTLSPGSLDHKGSIVPGSKVTSINVRRSVDGMSSGPKFSVSQKELHRRIGL
jgi:hypothetical protein